MLVVTVTVTVTIMGGRRYCGVADGMGKGSPGTKASRLSYITGAGGAYLHSAMLQSPNRYYLLEAFFVAAARSWNVVRCVFVLLRAGFGIDM